MLPSPATFEVVGKLGAGGMADVFLARATYRGGTRTVALKRIRLTLQEQPEVWAQFKREARVLEHLRHASIVGLEAVGEDMLGPYLALEYVDGATAARLAQRTVRAGDTTPLRAVLTLVRDAAEGIAYAHQLKHAAGVGVLHRDIAPDNLLVRRDGFCKVNDFGIARMEGQTRITSTGMVRGKLNYLAPELVHGQPPSVATDLFAFGATVFRLLTGQHAFRGSNDAEVLRNLMFSPPAPLTSFRSDVPARVSEWVQAAVSTDPQARLSLGELIEALPVPSVEDRAALAGWVAEVAPAGQNSQSQNEVAAVVRSAVVEPITPTTDPRDGVTPPARRPDDATAPPTSDAPTVRPGQLSVGQLDREWATADDAEPTVIPSQRATEPVLPAGGDSTLPPTSPQGLPDPSGQATYRMGPLPAERPPGMLVRSADGRSLGPVPDVKTDTGLEPATAPGEPTDRVSLEKPPALLDAPPRKGRLPMVLAAIVAAAVLAFGLWRVLSG